MLCVDTPERLLTHQHRVRAMRHRPPPAGWRRRSPGGTVSCRPSAGPVPPAVAPPLAIARAGPAPPTAGPARSVVATLQERARWLVRCALAGPDPRAAWHLPAVLPVLPPAAGLAPGLVLLDDDLARCQRLGRDQFLQARLLGGQLAGAAGAVPGSKLAQRCRRKAGRQR
jgi:hypothetical protein